MKRKLMIIIGLLIVFALAVLAGWFVMSRLYQGDTATANKQVVEPRSDENSKESTTSDDTGPTPTRFQAPAMTEGDAKELVANLLSQDMATYRMAFVVEEGHGVPPLSPVGTTIDIDLSTFTSLDTAGRVDSVITLPGKSPENWRMLLLYIDEQWRVYTMESM